MNVCRCKELHVQPNSEEKSALSSPSRSSPSAAGAAGMGATGTGTGELLGQGQLHWPIGMKECLSMVETAAAPALLLLLLLLPLLTGEDLSNRGDDPAAPLRSPVARPPPPW
jgi:hypothetical protein